MKDFQTLLNHQFCIYILEKLFPSNNKLFSLYRESSMKLSKVLKYQILKQERIFQELATKCQLK